MEMSGIWSSGCHRHTEATRCCSCRSSLSFHANMLSPSFFTASQMMSLMVSRSAFGRSLLLRSSLPMRRSWRMMSERLLLSHEMLSCSEIIPQFSTDVMSSGAVRNAVPVLPGWEYSEAMASHWCPLAESSGLVRMLSPLASL